MSNELSFDVEMTQEDLDQGKRSSCSACPAALAIRRAARFAEHDGEVTVSCARIAVGDYQMATPWEVAAFVESFDMGLIPDPISFRFVGFRR